LIAKILGPWLLGSRVVNDCEDLNTYVEVGDGLEIDFTGDDSAQEERMKKLRDDERVLCQGFDRNHWSSRNQATRSQ
jgi:hypothetical protein